MKEYSVKVAVVQATPVLFNRDATVEKACQLIREAASKGVELAEQADVMCRGGSAIISPLGEVIAAPLYDEEGILCAELDMGEIVRSKVDFDVVGHYARPDVFQLLVNKQPNPPVKNRE